jgi:hypothetical protein
MSSLRSGNIIPRFTTTEFRLPNVPCTMPEIPQSLDETFLRKNPSGESKTGLRPVLNQIPLRDLSREQGRFAPFGLSVFREL